MAAALSKSGNVELVNGNTLWSFLPNVIQRPILPIFTDMATTKPNGKRPREISNINTDLVGIYEDLASENGEIRLKAGLRLLSTKYSDTELDKILNRLFRGLCSSRKAARLGFSIALTEFLAHYAGSDHHFSLETVFQILREQTEPAPGSSGQELRDYYFGRLFAAEVLIKSKILYTVQASELWTNLINLVLDLYTKKQWLREECGWVLYQALLGFKDKPSLYNNVASLFEQLAKRNYLKTLESIVLWVECRSGGFDGLRLPTSVFHNDSPLHHKERRTLMTALQGTTTTTDDAETQVNQNRGATWSNKIHFAWIIIFDASQKVKTNGSLLSVNELVSDVRFTKLWHNFVDEYLFSPSASEQRKYWGFLMIQHYIRDWETPGSLLGPNFLRCFSNQLSKSDRHLHGIAVKTMKAILIVVDNHAKDNNRSCGILTSVIGSHYHVDFDKVTRTKFIEKVLAKADSSDQDSAVNMLSKAIITVPSDLDRPVAQWRIASADFLLITAKNQKTPKEQITKSKDCQKIVMKKIIRLFTYMAYCKVTLDTDHHQEYTPEIDQQTRDVFRSRLLSALSHLMTQTDDPSEMPALAANILLETDKNVQTPPISESEKSIFEDIQRAGRHMNQCEEKATSIPQSAADSSDNQKLYRAFRLLFALSIIQAFSGDADALNVLAELELACAKIKNDEMEYGFDAIVEVILSLIAKPSVLFRRVGKEVFSSCANFMNVDALDPMFEVLQKSENLSGQQELFDAEEANSDGEEEIESDSDSSTSTSQAGEDVEEDDEELLEFESKLAQALGTQRAEIELVDDGGEDSDGDMMDDEQMAALDPVMSNIFKQRKQTSSKKDNKNAKETIVQFKTKVLELLEIYIQQTAQGVSPENSATILLKCLDCIQRTKNKQVSERAAAVIKTALNVYKLSMESPRNKRILRRVGDALTEIHEIILLPGSNVYLRACSQASLFCVKVILNNGGAMEKVWRQYSLTGESMAVSQDIKVVNVLFQDWFNWLITAKITLSNRSKS